uniref:Uncharacterized protein n=1 Tax=Meloidogyne hapla TaxID=6305 RepID=A0A1I8AZL2_MELHA
MFRSHYYSVNGTLNDYNPIQKKASTPCEPVSPSPTVLLSPVLLSRPIRSQSAHSPNFLRNFGAVGGQQQHSDSESEPLTTACCSRGPSLLSRQSHSRLSNSRLSNCSSPLAGTPPLVCSPPIGLGIGGGSGGCRNVTRSDYLPHSSHSFSSRRGGSQIHRNQQHPLLAGRPPSAAAQLQRSQSDALNPIPSRHSSQGSGTEGGDFQSVILSDRLSGGGNGADNLRIGTTSKRPSISLRDLQQGEELNI